MNRKGRDKKVGDGKGENGSFVALRMTLRRPGGRVTGRKARADMDSRFRGNDKGRAPALRCFDRVRMTVGESDKRQEASIK